MLSMKLYALAFTIWPLAVCSAVIVAQAINEYPIDKLLESGVFAGLVALLLWQQWTREKAIRAENQERENRMATTIDQKEQFMQTQFVATVQTIATAIESLETLKVNVSQAVTDALARNAQQCESRGMRLIHEIHKHNRESHDDLGHRSGD